MRTIQKTSIVIQSVAKNLGYIKWVFVVTLCSFFVFTACEHRPLVEREEIPNRRWVRVYMDEAIRNVSYGFYNEELPKPAYRTPEVMRVVLCSPQTDDIVSEAYLRGQGADEKGNYLEGYVSAPPGQYRLLAYNFDTESVHVGYEYDYDEIYAYTNPISEELYGRLGCVRTVPDASDWTVVYEPDHFFIGNGEVVTVTEETDTLHTGAGTHFTATTSVKSYYLQVQVTGAELVTSAVALLSGMAGSVRVHDGWMMDDNPVAVHFSLQNGVDKDYPDKKVAYATFHTFGKLEEQENYLSITFEFYTKNGQTVTETIPLTDLFDTELVKVNQWILIDKVIAVDDALKIEPGDGGGMTPNVGEWENIEGDIYI